MSLELNFSPALLQRCLLPDPDVDGCGLVDSEEQHGPFDFDSLGAILLYLDDDDLPSLLAVSGVCRFWRWVANLLPQWGTALQIKLPAVPIVPQKAVAVRNNCMVELGSHVQAVRKSKRIEAQKQQEKDIEWAHHEYVDQLRFWKHGESRLYVVFGLLAVATLGLYIGAAASNSEWPGYMNEDETRTLRMRRFSGLCLGEKVPVECEAASEENCKKWEWTCAKMANVIADGPVKTFNGTKGAADTVKNKARWLCQGNQEQLDLFQEAVNLQLGGFCLHVVFSLVLIAWACGIDQLKWRVSYSLVVGGIVGLCLAVALFIMSLPLLAELHSTSCAPFTPTAEKLGWLRSSGVIGALCGMTLLEVGLCGVLAVVRHLRVRNILGEIPMPVFCC